MTGWNEYDAARHILEAPSIADRTKPFIEERGFDWDGLLAAYSSWSSGEQILVDAAMVFWNTHNDKGVLGRALWTLDTDNLARVLEAALIYDRRIGNLRPPS